MNLNFASGGAGLLIDMRQGIGQDYLDYVRRRAAAGKVKRLTGHYSTLDQLIRPLPKPRAMSQPGPRKFLRMAAGND